MNKQSNSGFRTPEKGKLVSSQYDGKCVCQICTCGKDRCPPKQLHVNPSHFDTTNKQYFQKWDVQKTPSIIPLSNQIHYGTQTFQSSYQRDYTPQKIQEQQLRSSQKSPLTQHRPFISQTEYNQKFKPYDTLPISMKPKYYYQENPNKFDCTTTYGENYRQQPIQQQNPIKPNERSFTPTKLQFNSTSKYQEDYTPKTANKATPIKHNNIPVGGLTHEKNSTYQKDYQLFNQDTYKKSDCPVRTLPYPDRSKSPNRHLVFSAKKNDWE